MRTSALWIALIALALLGRVAATADDDDPELEEALAVRSYEGNCLMCHGGEMVDRQRLTPKQWAAEVEKMVGWGAPLPKDEAPRLVAYLSKTYPSTREPAPTVAVDPAAIAADAPDAASLDSLRGDVEKGSKLFAAHCASCHGANALGAEVGVNLVELPVLSRPKEYRQVLREGRRRMPSFKPVLDAGAEDDILAWLRARG